MDGEFIMETAIRKAPHRSARTALSILELVIEELTELPENLIEVALARETLDEAILCCRRVVLELALQNVDIVDQKNFA